MKAQSREVNNIFLFIFSFSKLGMCVYLNLNFHQTNIDWIKHTSYKLRGFLVCIAL